VESRNYFALWSPEIISPYFASIIFSCYSLLWSRIQELTLINHICELIGQDTSVILSVLDYDQGWPQIWPHLH